MSSGGSGAFAIGDSINSYIDTGNDNAYQAFQLQVQNKQFDKDLALRQQQFGLQQDQFDLEKLLAMYELKKKQQSDDWMRQFRAALGNISSAGSPTTSAQQ
jgi:hypothetical protein